MHAHHWRISIRFPCRRKSFQIKVSNIFHVQWIHSYACGALSIDRVWLNLLTMLRHKSLFFIIINRYWLLSKMLTSFPSKLAVYDGWKARRKSDINHHHNFNWFKFHDKRCLLNATTLFLLPSSIKISNIYQEMADRIERDYSNCRNCYIREINKRKTFHPLLSSSLSSSSHAQSPQRRFCAKN